MIKTKIIVKPKDGSSSSGSVTEGSYGSGYADYAASAGRSKQSDRSALATLAETAISAYRAKRADMASELDPDSETLQGYVLKEWLGKLLSVVDVDGTEQDINGTVGDGMKIKPHLDLTSVDVSGDGHISLGGMQMVYDAAHGAWRLDGSLYVTGGLSALGNSDTTGGGGGLMGSIVPYAKAIALTTQNEGEEIASAWSVKMLYDKIETIDVSGQLTSYLTKQEAQSLYQPIGNYLTAITKAQVEGVLTGNITTHTHNYAGSSTAGGDANKALAVVDYGDVTKIIKIGYSGAGLTTSNLTKIAGFATINGVRHIKDVPKGVLQNWLGLGSSAYTDSSAYAPASHTHSQYLTTHQDISGKADRSELSKYLPLTGGTLTGNLNLNFNALTTGELKLLSENDNWNFTNKDSVKLLSYNGSAPATGAPKGWCNGISFMTHYTGFQLCSYGGGDDELFFRKFQDTSTWHSWYRIYHEGFKPTKSDVGLGNVDNTADANKSVSYASTAGSATKLQTARTIWGQPFDGTKNIEGTFKSGAVYIGNGNELYCTGSLYINYGPRTKTNVFMCAAGGGNVGIGTESPLYKLHVAGDTAITGKTIVGSIQIGDITITYDKEHKGLRIAGGGLYTDSYLSSLGVDASTALSVKKWADSIQITTESDAELATAYSIGNLYRMINSNQKSITQSLNQSVSALQGRCTSLEQRVSALENKVNK